MTNFFDSPDQFVMYFSRKDIFALLVSTFVIGTGYLLFTAFHLSSKSSIMSKRRSAGSYVFHAEKPSFVFNTSNVMPETVTKQQEPHLMRVTPPRLPPDLKDLTVIYYIVPKCGSRTLFYLMGQLKQSNPYLRDVLALTSAEKVTRDERTKYVPKFVMQAKKPAFLYVDTHFVNVKYPKNVMYVSIVRDPLQRFLSQFSFHNSGDNLTAPQEDRDWVRDKKTALDECVEQERQICSGRWLGRAIHSRFCGTGVICYQTCRKNLKQGKRNLLQKYHVVGMLEEFEDFLLVLERLVPSLFTGILDLYRQPSTKEFLAKVKTAEKVSPSEDTQVKLKEYLQKDYEFYNAVKSKFYKLKEKLGIPSNI